MKNKVLTLAILSILLQAHLTIAKNYYDLKDCQDSCKQKYNCYSTVYGTCGAGSLEVLSCVQGRGTSCNQLQYAIAEIVENNRQQEPLKSLFVSYYQQCWDDCKYKGNDQSADTKLWAICTSTCGAEKLIQYTLNLFIVIISFLTIFHI